MKRIDSGNHRIWCVCVCAGQRMLARIWQKSTGKRINKYCCVNGGRAAAKASSLFLGMTLNREFQSLVQQSRQQRTLTHTQADQNELPHLLLTLSTLIPSAVINLVPFCCVARIAALLRGLSWWQPAIDVRDSQRWLHPNPGKYNQNKMDRFSVNNTVIQK